MLCPRPRSSAALLALALGLAACDDKPKPTPAVPSASASAAAVVSAAPPPEPARPSAPPTEIVCQHILVNYSGATKAKRATRTKEEARKRASFAASEAKENPDDFDDLVKRFSDDPSAARAGSTGLVKRADLVKSFADVAFALKVGEVSGVVETPFGFHVIKRTQ